MTISLLDSEPVQLLRQHFALQSSEESHVCEDMWIRDIVLVRMQRRKPNVPIKMLKWWDKVQRGMTITIKKKKEIDKTVHFYYFRSDLLWILTFRFTPPPPKPFA